LKSAFSARDCVVFFFFPPPRSPPGPSGLFPSPIPFLCLSVSGDRDIPALPSGRLFFPTTVVQRLPPITVYSLFPQPPLFLAPKLVVLCPKIHTITPPLRCHPSPDLSGPDRAFPAPSFVNPPSSSCFLPICIKTFDLLLPCKTSPVSYWPFSSADVAPSPPRTDCPSSLFF